MTSELGRSYAQAWSSKRPERVASFYALDGQIIINNGQPLRGHEAVSKMAAGFYTAFPDLIVHCDDFRLAGTHALFAWTLEGHHAETKRRVRIGGWGVGFGRRQQSPFVEGLVQHRRLRKPDRGAFLPTLKESGDYVCNGSQAATRRTPTQQPGRRRRRRPATRKNFPTAPGLWSTPASDD